MIFNKYQNGRLRGRLLFLLGVRFFDGQKN